MAVQLRRAARPVAVGPVAHGWQGEALWILGAAALGFAVSFLFSSVLGVGRNWFVLAYLAVSVPFFIGYGRWSGIDLAGLARRRWWAGVLGGAIVGGLLTWFVLDQQTPSPRQEGWAFVGDLFWLGVVYGVLDALLLNVLPVLAAWRASSAAGHTGTLWGKVATGAVALVASLLVTAAYHLGYAEFRNAEVGSALFGNTIMTAGYILSGNPITAIIGHVALHLTSVVHSLGTSVTLPPHY